MEKYEVMTDAELAREIHVISGVLAGRTFGDKWEAASVEETIEHEGLVLRQVEREARGGDYIRLTERQANETVFVTANKFYKVGESEGTTFFIVDTGVKFEVYNENSYRLEKNVEVFEVVGAIASQDNGQRLPWAPAQVKSANQQRAELIERAKEFVEEHTEFNAKVAFTNAEGISFNQLVVVPEFIVNKDKRTVVVLLKGAFHPIVITKGIAKCMPSDVFNEWIGKAIALARALEINVPEEFLNAVQPDEFVIGQKVTVFERSNPEKIHVQGELVGIESQGMLNFSEEDYLNYFGCIYKRTSTSGNKTLIIDDTNAENGTSP